jgi:hypothetical protein
LSASGWVALKSTLKREDKAGSKGFACCRVAPPIKIAGSVNKEVTEGSGAIQRSTVINKNISPILVDKSVDSTE